MSSPRVVLSTIYHLLSTRKEQLLFALLVLTIPLQIRWFFKNLSGLTDVEWTQGWIWLSDVVLMAVLLVWLRRQGHQASRALWPILFSAPVFALAAVSENPILGLWFAIKLAEALALFSYVRANRNIVFSRSSITAFMAITAIMALVAIAQFGLQHDLGLQKIGESELSPTLPAVAKFLLEDGTKIMRAYGLAPHPNIAATLFLAAIFFIAWAYLKRGVGLVWRYSLQRQKEELAFGISLFIVLLALAVTFSRSAWLGLALGIGVLVLGVFAIPKLRRAYLWEALRFLSLVIVIVGLLYLAVPGMQTRTGIDPSEQAVKLRQFFNEQAIEMIKEKPPLGVGPGQFVEELAARHTLNTGQEVLTLGPVLLQPVHNLPLLWAAEYGIPLAVALSLLLLLVIVRFALRLLREQNTTKTLSALVLFSFVFSFVPFVLFDHFFWTLQQGRFFFFAMLALLL